MYFYQKIKNYIHIVVKNIEFVWLFYCSIELIRLQEKRLPCVKGAVECSETEGLSK